MMFEEKNGNVYSEKLANDVRTKLNSFPFAPQNFKLSYGLEGYEVEKSRYPVASNPSKAQMKVQMENHNSRIFFEAMRIKSANRQQMRKKSAGEKPANQQQGKFYHLNFEPIRIEDYHEIESIKNYDEKIENQNEKVDAFKNKMSLPMGETPTSQPTFSPKQTNFPKNLFSLKSPKHFTSEKNKEENNFILANVNASKFLKKGISRKLPALPPSTPPTRLSSTMPDLIATTKTPSIAEEIMSVFALEKKNNPCFNNFKFPACCGPESFYKTSPPQTNIYTMSDLGNPEIVDPVKKYSDLYLNELYVKSIICHKYNGNQPICERLVDDQEKEEEDEEKEDPVKFGSGSDSSPLYPEPETEKPKLIDKNLCLKTTPSLPLLPKRSPDSGIELSRNSSFSAKEMSASTHEGFYEIENYLEEEDATHRGCNRFMPRHPEELEVEIGDGLFVEKEHEDLWCEGINLRTKKRGIFPTAYATDLSLLGEAPKFKYFVSFLGSIQIGQHTGHQILCKAIKKLVNARKNSHEKQNVLSCLEIDENGVKLSERKKKTSTSRILSTLSKLNIGNNLPSEHIFLLKNITFCGILPSNEKYLGIITKHPSVLKFACHVFQASTSGRPIVETIGNALSRFHEEYLSVAYPVEDIYFE